MIITRDILIALPPDEYNKIMAIDDEDLVDLLYLLLHDLLLESAIEIPDRFIPDSLRASVV